MQGFIWKDFLQFVDSQKGSRQIVIKILNQAKPEIKDSFFLLHCSKGEKMYLDTRVKALAELLLEFTQKEYTVQIVQHTSQKKGKKEEAPLLEYKPSEEELFLKAGLNVKYTFDNFAVSTTNQVAYAAAQAVAMSPGTAYNPLFLYGGVGVGKTHLAQSVARYILEKNNEKKTFFCPSDRFTNELIESMREKTTQKFRRKYRPLSLLIIDDIQFIAGKARVQEEFFHTFNDILSAGGQVILTSDRPPSEIKDLEDRLRSRFSGGMIVDINEPDYELRTAIVLIKAQEKSIEIDMDSAKAIAEKIEDTRALEGTLVSIYGRLQNREDGVTLAAVQNHFSTDKKRTATRVSPSDVIKAVCTFYNIKQSHIKSPTRVENVAFARQVIMFILVRELGINLKEVAYMLHRNDHTTIMHGRDKIDRLIMIDKNFKEELDTILNSLKVST